MNEREYASITPELIADQGDTRSVRIQYGDVRMDLPRLDDTRSVPMTVLAMGLNVVSRGWDNLDQEERIGALSVFLAYLLREYPRLERELDRKSGDKIKDIGRIIAEWCRQSDADPKS